MESFEEKPKKVQKMFDTFKLQIQNSISAFETRTNDDLVKYKKKIDSMYGVLVREFLVKLENRVRVAEVTSLSLVRVYIKKLYELEQKIDPSFNLSYDEYVKKMETSLETEQQIVVEQIERDDRESMEPTKLEEEKNN